MGVKYAIATLLILSIPQISEADRGPKISKPECVEVILCSGDAPGCRPCIGRRPPPNCSGEGPNCVPAPPNCSGCILVPEDDPWIDTLLDAGCDPLAETRGELLLDCGDRVEAG